MRRGWDWPLKHLLGSTVVLLFRLPTTVTTFSFTFFELSFGFSFSFSLAHFCCLLLFYVCFFFAKSIKIIWASPDVCQKWTFLKFPFHLFSDSFFEFSFLEILWLEFFLSLFYQTFDGFSMKLFQDLRNYLSLIAVETKKKGAREFSLFHFFQLKFHFVELFTNNFGLFFNKSSYFQPFEVFRKLQNKNLKILRSFCSKIFFFLSRKILRVLLIPSKEKLDMKTKTFLNEWREKVEMQRKEMAIRKLRRAQMISKHSLMCDYPKSFW